ncbi:hypothetical protein B0H12DRAFT_1099126 [Mycena haematopus]|nr:hypothetical protein B0H12DRAFT_1099126 [Mycena haematopus]
MPILSALHQVLNCFIHNGPLLARASPLVEHIRLNTLIVQICVRDPEFEERRGTGRRSYEKAIVGAWKKRLRRELEGYISRVVSRGLFFGAVDKIVCWSTDDDDGEVTEWSVCSKEIGDMTEWNRYNFGWGVAGSSSLSKQPSHSTKD